MSLRKDGPLHWKVYGKAGVRCGRSVLRVRYEFSRDEFKAKRARGEKVCPTCSRAVDTEEQQ